MRQVDRQSSAADGFDWLSGGGEMGRRIRSFDWSGTPLGAAEDWPQSLKTAVNIMLNSRYAMFVWWGQELINLYNDSYTPMLGKRHPEALGQPASQIWSEIWSVVGPQTETVLNGGSSTWNEAVLLILERYGYPEETYFTFSYSPAFDDAGQVGGIFAAVTEETGRVLSERRLRILRELSLKTSAETHSVREACERAAATIGEFATYDIPFALLYLVDEEGRKATLQGAAGIKPGTVASPPVIALDRSRSDAVSGEVQPSSSWPLGHLRAGLEICQIDDIQARYGTLACGPWPEPPGTALVLSIGQTNQARPAGYLVAGVSPRLALDEEYVDFLRLVAGQIETAMASARAFEEQRERAEALAELDRAKTTFFNNVSHEFRTPLTLMLGPLNDVLHDPAGRLSNEERETLAVVNGNGIRLLKLVNSLLDFSRIEAGRVRASYEPVDISGVTAELASVFRAATDRAGLQLVVDCPSLSEPVYVDREMWEKIVLNLVSNAYKFTFEGEISISVQERDGLACLEVRDTGVGIPKKELPRLFERFHRIEGSRGRTHEGSGIGLALVQELVKLHGGSVEVESEEGIGTAFRVLIPFGANHLPKDRVQASRTLALTATSGLAFVEEALRWTATDDKADSLPFVDSFEQPGAEVDIAGKRVLVVDDNSDMRMYVTRLLSGSYRVQAASNGVEALEMMRACRPDLVLTDIMMPRLDGFGLLRALRSDPAFETLPVIMLSARAGEEARAEGLDHGADDYLVKPFSARELLATVRAHIAMSQIREEATETLRYRREQVESLLNHAPLGIYLVDSNFRIREVNPIARAVFGDIPGGVIGRDFGEIIHHLWERDYADEVVRIFRGTLETGERFFMPEREEFRVDRNATEFYEWRLDRITLPDGNFGVVCYFRDVSTQVQARRAIAKTEEERKRAAIGLRAIAARARCLLWYADVEDCGEPDLRWRQRMADEEAARRFLPIEVAPGQSYGQALADARLPEDRKKMAWGDEEVRAGRSYRQEFRVRDARGHVRWLAEDVQIEAIGPNRWNAVGICVDITERKRTEEDRERHHVEIEALNDRLRRAMAETHHRVKNNLQVVSALVDLQTMSDGSDVPVDELVRIGQHIRSLAAIHDLLTQNAKGNGTEDVILTREVIDKLAPLLRSIVGERSIRFEVEDIALAQRQGTSLAVLVNELVSNAVKHGSGEIEVSLAVAEDRARLAVCDEGPGFSQAFDPIKARNTGLELIESVGRYDLLGTIRYENRPGGGARVVVDFPRPKDGSGDPEETD